VAESCPLAVITSGKVASEVAQLICKNSGRGCFCVAWERRQLNLQLDDIDIAIANLLIQHGRMPAARIARELGYLTPRTASNRVRRLIDKGIVRVGAVLNPRALGYNVLANVSVQGEPPRVRAVAELVARLDRVNYVAVIAGNRDVSVQANATDVEDLRRFIEEDILAIPGVRQTRTALLAKVIKEIYDWRIPVEVAQGAGAHAQWRPRAASSAAATRMKIDELDRAIVDQLMEDGRMSCSDIASSVGSVSDRTVCSRIERLTRSGVIAGFAVANAQSLGYGITADLSVEVEPGRRREVAARAAELQRVSYVATAAGDRDIAVQVFAVDVDDLEELFAEQLEALPGVRAIRTSLVTSIVKDIYHWRMPAKLPSQAEG
jgi:Lrp/AsnC family transcriptional regulator for asnA, asnC and gidA